MSNVWDTVPRTPEGRPKITITPRPRFPATAGEMAAEGDYPGPDDADLEAMYGPDDVDLEPKILKRQDDRSEVGGFLEAVTGAVPDVSGLFVSMAEAGTLGDNTVARREAERAKAKQAFIDMATAAAKDVARGATEAPRQIAGGARDAVQAAINGIGALGDWMNANVGAIEPLLGMEPPPAKTDMPQLPAVKEAESTTGGIVREIAQFLTGFGAAGKALGAAAGTGFRAAATKGAVADLAAFEAHEGRLSDLIQKVPALQNPVTEYLARSGDEGELEGRFKRAVEGLGLGVVTEGLFRGLKAIKAARAARAGQDVSEEAAKAAATPRQAAPMTALGDAAPDAPLAGKALDFGVPDDIAAKSLTAKGLTPLGHAKDGVFINFARINTAEDIKRVIADTANAFKDDIDALRRGTRTNTQTVEAAAKVDAWEALASRRIGEPLNAETSLAVRNLWEASGQKLLEVSELAARQPSPENLFQFRKMLETHRAIQGEVIAARTETGRALQAWKIPAGGSREQMTALDDLINKTGGLDFNAAFAAKIAALKYVPNGLQALDNFVERSRFARTLDALVEARTMALLSGPKTHIVNTMSNAAVAAHQIVERWMASRWSQLFGTGEVPVGEAAAQSFGLMSGIKDAFRYAGKTFASGQSGYGMNKLELPFDRAISAEALKMRGDTWLGRGVDALGTAINLPGRALLTEDEFFKTIGYRMEIHAQAFRMASAEVAAGKLSPVALKGRIADIVANPPENIRLAAIDAATYQTFTSTPGTLVQALNKMEGRYRESGVGGQLGAALMRIVVPFRNTPANIFKYTMERTPLAPLFERYRDAIAQGGATADIARTRMALGTMTIMLATDIAMDGHITGSGPGRDERGKRDALLRSGWQPYSVKIGNRYFAYNRMDPIGFTLGLGADLGEYMSEADYSEANSLEIQKAFSAALFSIGNNALNKNYMRGMAEFVNAISEPERYGSRWIEKFAGSFVPITATEATRFIDPYMRMSHDMISELKKRTPGMSQELPMLRDLWGRPKTYSSGLGAAYDAISPVYSRQEKIEPIDQEMFDQGWFMAAPQRRVGGVSLSEHPEAFSRYLELRGQTRPSELGDKKLRERYGDQNLLDTLNAIVTDGHPLSREYKALGSAEDKEKFIRKVRDAFGRAARAKLKAEFPKIFSDDGED